MSATVDDLTTLFSDPSFEDKALRFASDAACQVVYITKQRYVDDDEGESSSSPLAYSGQSPGTRISSTFHLPQPIPLMSSLRWL